MLSTASSHVPPSKAPVLASETVSARNARITAIALAFIAAFLIVVSCILFGIGSMDPTQNMGLGAFAYLGGTCFSFIALGIVVGAIGFGGYYFAENRKKGDKDSLSLCGRLC